MRTLPQKARDLSSLDEREQRAIALIGRGVSPHDVAEQLGMDEPQVFRLVTGVLDEAEPPGGPSLTEVHRRHGTQPASAVERDAFDAEYGRSRPADDEG